MRPEIILAADVYDKLKAVAERMGGVGKATWFRYDSALGREDVNCPVCINGMAVTAGLVPMYNKHNPVLLNTPDNAVGIPYEANDEAVDAILRRQGRPRFSAIRGEYQRVSWADYCAELRIVRGAEVTT